MMPNFPPMDSKQIEEMETLFEDVRKFNEQENKTLKKLFAGKIKQNFLIEIKERIMGLPEYTNLMITQYGSFDFSSEALLIGKENSALDLCKFITMIHFFNTMTMDNAKRALCHDNEEYKSKLINQVLEAIKLRNIALMYNSKDSLEGYYPLTYGIYTLNNYMIVSFDEMMKQKKLPKGKNREFKSQLHAKMLNKIKAILIMVDNSLIEEAFNPLRSLVELFMLYLALFNADKEAVEAYTNHVKYQIDYQIEKIIPDVVEKQVDKLKSEGCTASKIDYLNYGWLDSIFEYGYINKCDRKYKIIDLAELLDMLYGKECGRLGNKLYNYYRDCSLLSHGSSVNLERFTSKQSVLEKVCFILGHLASDFEKQYDLKFIVNDIDVINYLKDIYDRQLEYNKDIYSNEDLLKSLNNEYVHRIK